MRIRGSANYGNVYRVVNDYVTDVGHAVIMLVSEMLSLVFTLMYIVLVNFV